MVQAVAAKVERGIGAVFGIGISVSRVHLFRLCSAPSRYISFANVINVKGVKFIIIAVRRKVLSTLIKRFKDDLVTGLEGCIKFNVLHFLTIRASCVLLYLHTASEAQKCLH